MKNATLFLLKAAAVAVMMVTVTLNGFGQYSQTSVADAFVDALNPSTNYGTAWDLYIGKQYSSDYLYTYVKWDISSLPTCINITSATITLYQWTSNSGSGITTNIRRVTQSWNENSITYNNQPTAVYSGSYGQISFNSTPGYITLPPADALVNDWITFGNYGLELQTNISAPYDLWQSIESREATSSGKRPKLEITYTTNTPSTAPSSISVSQNPVCTGNSTILTRQGGSLGTGASWEWYKNGCGSTYVGSGNSITVTPTTTTTYYVRAEGDCNSTSCASVTVNVNSTPSQPGTISGPSNPCSTSQNYSINPVSGAATYSWSYSGGGTPNGTGPSCTLTPTSSGTLSVTANNSCGSSTPRTKSITVAQIPGTASVTGPSNVPTGSSQTYTASSSNASSYSWTIPSGWSGSSTTNTIQVTVGSSLGNVCVKGQNGCGYGTQGCEYITVTGIEELTSLTSLSIYPNPNSGRFVLEMELTKPQEMEIKMLNVIGQVVYSEWLGKVSGSYHKELNLQKLAKGVYTLQLKTAEGTVNREVMLR